MCMACINLKNKNKFDFTRKQPTRTPSCQHVVEDVAYYDTLVEISQGKTNLLLVPVVFLITLAACGLRASMSNLTSVSNTRGSFK